MSLDKKIVESLRLFPDHEIARLLRSVHLLFQRKFPPENIDIQPHVNNEGYHIRYKSSEYSFGFTKQNTLRCLVTATFSIDQKFLEEYLNKNFLSNTKFDTLDYFRGRKISFTDDSVQISCIFKSIPQNDAEAHTYIDQLWGHIIRPIMAGIHIKS